MHLAASRSKSQLAKQAAAKHASDSKKPATDAAKPTTNDANKAPSQKNPKHRQHPHHHTPSTSPKHANAHAPTAEEWPPKTNIPLLRPSTPNPAPLISTILYDALLSGNANIHSVSDVVSFNPAQSDIVLAADAAWEQAYRELHKTGLTCIITLGVLGFLVVLVQGWLAMKMMRRWADRVCVAEDRLRRERDDRWEMWELYFGDQGDEGEESDGEDEGYSEKRGEELV